MKRNNLTTAVIAGIAGVAGVANMANAVNLNPDGLGQVLIFPYYTVNGGNNTLISVVNTHNEGKAVKVRFLEGYNSREVLDFNLYLSPYDVWTATLFSLDESGVGNLVTDDTSCTVPAIRTNTGLKQLPPPDNRRYAEFLTYAFDGQLGGYGDPSGEDSGPTNAARTREGHFEMIEMGVVVNGPVNNLPAKNTLAAITHVPGGSPSVPKNCAQVEAAWTGGYWGDGTDSVAVNHDITAPTGGLFGSASIIQVAKGIINAYNADAIDGFRTLSYHTFPGDLLPSIADAQTSATYATSYVFDNGDLIISDYPLSDPNGGPSQGIDAVSSLFMADAIYNEYGVSSSIGAASEWVVTLPTKRFYVDPGITSTVIAPFTELFGGVVDGRSCFRIDLSPYDREENRPTGTVIFSPPPPTGVNTLCYESQVLTFGQSGSSSAVLGSKLISNVPTNYQSGWLRLGLTGTVATPHRMRPSADGNVFHGLPVAGFLSQSLINANAVQGVLANYSGLFRHRVSRSCTTTTPAPSGAVCS